MGEKIMNSASTVFQSKEVESEQRYSNKHLYVFLQISLWYFLYEIVKKKTIPSLRVRSFIKLN